MYGRSLIYAQQECYHPASLGQSGVHVIKIMEVITRGYSTCFCATIDETITLSFVKRCFFKLEVVAAAAVSSGEMPPSAGFRQDALLVEHEQSMIAIVGFSGLNARPSDLITCYGSTPLRPL